MLAHHLLVGSDVDAVDFVIGDVALQPLDLWAELVQHRAGFLRDGLNLVGGKGADSRNFTLNLRTLAWNDLLCNPGIGIVYTEAGKIARRNSEAIR